MASLLVPERELRVLLVCPKTEERSLVKFRELLDTPDLSITRVHAVHEAVRELRYQRHDFVLFVFERSWRGVRFQVWSRFIDSELGKIPFGLIGPNSCKVKTVTPARSFYFHTEVTVPEIIRRMARAVSRKGVLTQYD